MQRGYDRLYGARPLARVIQEAIKRPLADELLFGQLVNGGEVRVHIRDDKPSFEITPSPPKARRRRKPAALPAPSEQKD